MKFKNNDDSRYFTRFLRDTEKKIKDMTCIEFITYLKENAVDIDTDFICIDDEQVKCSVYVIREEQSRIEKEFIVTEDNRVFYYRTLNAKHELVDGKKQELSSKIVWDGTFCPDSYNFYAEAKKVEKQINKDDYVIGLVLRVNSDLRTRMLKILEECDDDIGRYINYILRINERYLNRIYYVKEHRYMATIDLVLKKFILERI